MLTPAEITHLTAKVAAILEEASGYAEAWHAVTPNEEERQYRHAVQFGSLSVSIENGRENGRLHIAGETPRELSDAFRHASRNVRAPSITVSADRSPREIAREITRRVLPQLREYVQQLRQVQQLHNQREQAREDAAAAITAALEAAGLPANCRAHYASSDRLHISPANYPGPSFSFEVQPGGSIELKANLTAADAVRLAAILATAERPW